MSGKQKKRANAQEWNIEGISEEVIAAMKEDKADIGDVGDYVRKICYWSVFSKEPDDAVLVSAQVKQMVEDKYEDDAMDNPYGNAKKGKCEACGELEPLIEGHCEYCRVISVQEEKKMKKLKKTIKLKKP